MLARLADVPAGRRRVRSRDDGPPWAWPWPLRGGVDDPPARGLARRGPDRGARGRYGRLLTPVSTVVTPTRLRRVFTWWDELPFLAFCLTHPDQARPRHGLIAVARRSRPRATPVTSRHRDQPARLYERWAFARPSYT